MDNALDIGAASCIHFGADVLLLLPVQNDHRESLLVQHVPEGNSLLDTIAEDNHFSVVGPPVNDEFIQEPFRSGNRW